MKSEVWKRPISADRRNFIGGSDARIIMGDDEAALLRLWREKRGEAEAEDLSTNLIVQLGVVTEGGVTTDMMPRDWAPGPSPSAATGRGMSFRPKRACADRWTYACVAPPRRFITVAMDLAMVSPARRDRELITDLASKRAALTFRSSAQATPRTGSAPQSPLRCAWNCPSSAPGLKKNRPGLRPGPKR